MKKNPVGRYSCASLPDPKMYPEMYPKVAVQLPMFNEMAVCQQIIDFACEMEWPREKFTVQVLDDSTDKHCRDLVDHRVRDWQDRGVSCEVFRRTNRKGYKAGAMKEGLEILQKQGWDYVAIFDADFRPDKDFLLRTVPYMMKNTEIAYVQGRWIFSNPWETLLSKVQYISLSYHMKCEQWSHFSSGSFFNFNGTAGVWRICAIEDAGGWNARTTVEDMDLSLRSYYNGWKAIFLDDLQVENELPVSYEAYRKQQHRWTCGPVQLSLKACMDVAYSKLPFIRKFELLFFYFFVRKVSCHLVTFFFFCTLVPLSAFTPEVRIPLWVLFHLPIVVTISTSLFAQGGIYYSIFYVLLENAMSLVKINAVFQGLLGLKRANEWIVTLKMGKPLTAKNGYHHNGHHKNGKIKIGGFKVVSNSTIKSKLWFGEIMMGILLIIAARQAFLVQGVLFGLYNFFQGLAFLFMGFNLIDVNMRMLPVGCWRTGGCWNRRCKV